MPFTPHSSSSIAFLCVLCVLCVLCGLIVFRMSYLAFIRSCKKNDGPIEVGENELARMTGRRCRWQRRCYPILTRRGVTSAPKYRNSAEVLPLT